jgi:adenylyltransferase/sulfurtransferase
MSGFDSERYSRQTRFAGVGADGQRKLAAASVAVVGCGALGGAVAVTLARAGVGTLRLVDRDVPELSNLPRQVLFDEADVAAGLPKAVAAARHLARINSAGRYEPVVVDLAAANVAEVLGGVDLIVDGSDNFEARFLVNEFACRQGVPWVYGGAIGAEGRVLAIIPGRTACLRCLVPEPPAPGALPTCDTAGIIGPAALVVGAVEAAQAMRLIVGGPVDSRLLVCDLWSDAWRTVDLTALAAAGCPTCRGGDYPWLEGRVGATAATLCGRDAVQVLPATRVAIDLEAVAGRLAAVGAVSANAWMVRAEVEPGIQLSVFADGRAIVTGTRVEPHARGIVARYLGG